jgi:glucose-1-phosphate adenylyltransferase
MERAVAMILAGGRGRRMDILCHLRPKPAIPFAGKLRIIDFSLSNCIHSQISNIAVLVDYQRGYLTDCLREWGAANAPSGQISILQPDTGSYLGTADAVYKNLAYLNGQAGTRALILAGDHVYRMDYRKMLDFHEKVKADATVAITRVPVEEAHRFGTVVIDAESRIQEFTGKSSKSVSTLASMGIYIFNKEVLTERLCEDASKQDSIHDFGYTVLPGMVKHDKVYAYEFNGYWQDVGTVEAYYQANMELLSTGPRFSLNSNWPVLNDKNAIPVPRGSKDGRVVNSLIGQGCIIKGRVENSVLSPGVRVEEKATVRDSIVMANTVVGYHSVVDRCILDEGVQIGRFCYIGFGSSLLSGNCDITVLGEEVVVPDHTAIGRKCKVLPKAGLDDFTGSLVPADTIVRPGARISP